MSAISKKAGMEVMTVVTRQRFHASKRTWRMSTFSRADAMDECQRRYSRHHCFARIPRRAAARLSTKLVAHRVFIVTTVRGTWKAIDSGSDCAVSFRRGFISSGVLP